MKRQFVSALSGFAHQVLSAAVRTVVTTVVFATGVVLVLRSMGVPMPTASELLRQLEPLSKLAKMIS